MKRSFSCEMSLSAQIPRADIQNHISSHLITGWTASSLCANRRFHDTDVYNVEFGRLTDCLAYYKTPKTGEMYLRPADLRVSLSLLQLSLRMSTAPIQTDASWPGVRALIHRHGDPRTTTSPSQRNATGSSRAPGSLTPRTTSRAPRERRRTAAAAPPLALLRAPPPRT